MSLETGYIGMPNVSPLGGMFIFDGLGSHPTNAINTLSPNLGLACLLACMFALWAYIPTPYNRRGYLTAFFWGKTRVGSNCICHQSYFKKNFIYRALFAVGLLVMSPFLLHAQHYTISLQNGVVWVEDMAGLSDSLSIGQQQVGFMVLSAPGRTFKIGGGVVTQGATAPIALAGVSEVRIRTGAGNDVLRLGALPNAFPSMVLDAGTGDDVVRFEGDIAFKENAHLDVDLQNDAPVPGMDQIRFVPNANVKFLGGGYVTLKVSRSVLLEGGSSLETEDGSLLVEANQQTVPTSGVFVGVDVAGGMLWARGKGQITVKGRGGDAGEYQHGVQIYNVGTIQGGLEGNVLVQGTGGPSLGNHNYGVRVSGGGSNLGSAGAALNILGQGGGLGNSANNYGVSVASGGIVKPGGNGPLTLVGKGGNTFGAHNYGVFVSRSNSLVGTVGGHLKVEGYGGGSGASSNNYGVHLFSAGAIVSGGTGNNTIEGYGGKTDGSTNYGVFLDGSASRVATMGGSVFLYGAGGSGADGRGVQMQNFALISTIGNGAVNVQGHAGEGSTRAVRLIWAASISSVDGDIAIEADAKDGQEALSLSNALPEGASIVAYGKGAIRLTANSMDFSTQGVSIAAHKGSVWLHALDKKVPVELTPEEKGNVLCLSNAELSIVASDTLRLGDPTSSLVVASDLVLTRPHLLWLSGSVTQLAGGRIEGGDKVLVEAPSCFKAAQKGIDVLTQTLMFRPGSYWCLPLDGPLPDSQYQRLVVQGRVDLSNLTLSLEGQYVPQGCTMFTLLDNDGTDSIIGTFKSLPEGATFSNFRGSGLDATLSYRGGTGNDVVLSLAHGSPIVENCPSKSIQLSTDDVTSCLLTVPQAGTPGLALRATDPCGGSLVFTQNRQTYAAQKDGETFEVLYEVVNSGGMRGVCRVVYEVLTPEVEVLGNQMSIVTGDSTPSPSDHTYFGVYMGAPIVRTFTVRNLGSVPLRGGNVPWLRISGAQAPDFTLLRSPALPIPPGGSTTFEIAFSPLRPGTRRATITLSTNDCDERGYTFEIMGHGCSVPVFSACPNHVTVNASAGQCAAVVTYGALADAPLSFRFSGASNTTGSGSGSGVQFQTGLTQVVLSAINGCGTATCAFTVTVSDHLKPTLTCPPNVTLNAEQNCAAPYTLADPVSDNCLGASWGASFAGNPSGLPANITTRPDGAGSGPLAFQKGNTTVTLTAVDAGGNTAIPCIFSVAVADKIKPMLTCPNSPLMTNMDNGNCDATLSWPDPMAENCNGGSWGALFSGNPLGAPNNLAGRQDGAGSGPLIFQKGTTLVSLTATDLDGNAADPCTFSIVVADAEPPTLTCPTSLTLSTGSSDCVALYALADPLADNCGGASWGVVFSNNPNGTPANLVGRPDGQSSPNLTLQKGTTVLTLNAADASGNAAATCSFSIAVVDRVVPVLTCPPTVLLSTDPGTCTASYVLADPIWDNCAGAVWGASFAGNALGTPAHFNNRPDGQPSPIMAFQKGSTWVALTGLDAQGNAAAGGGCSFEVRVEDKTRPTLQCPTTPVVLSAPNGSNNAVFAFLDPLQDACPGAVWGAVFVPTLATGPLAGIADGTGSGNLNFPIGNTTVTLQATDAAGNTAQPCTFVVTVVSNGPPMLQCPSAGLVVSTALGTCAASQVLSDPIMGTYSGARWNLEFSGNPNGMLAPVSGLADGQNSPALPFQQGVTTVRITANDAQGRAATPCSFSLTVRDQEAPQITCPPNLTLLTDPNACTATPALGIPIVTDNCALPKGNALDFDGVNDGVLVNNPANLNFGKTAPFTIETWARTTATSQRILFSKAVGTPEGTGYIFYVENGRLGLALNRSYVGGQAIVVLGTANFADGQWHHFAATYDGSGQAAGVLLYVDGTLQTSNTLYNNLTGDIQNNAMPEIGRRTFYGTALSPFKGIIDELRVWARVRTAAEINTLKDRIPTGAETGLLLYMPFDEGVAGGNNTSVIVAPDRAGGDNFGTLINFANQGSTSNWVAGNGTSRATATHNALPALPLGNHTIRWIATDLAGNTRTCEQTVTVQAGPQGCRTNDAEDRTEIDVAKVLITPNPFTCCINIQFTLDNAGTTMFTLHDAQGRLVLTHQGVYGSGLQKVPLSLPDHCPAGVYWATLRTATGLKVEKVVRQ